MRFFKINRSVAGPDLHGWAVSVGSDRWALLSIAVWFISLLLCLSALIYFYSRLPDRVPVFFSRVWGEARLDERGSLWTLPAIAALVGGINFGVGASLHANERFLSRVMFSTGALVAWLTLLAVVNIILLMQ